MKKNGMRRHIKAEFDKLTFKEMLLYGLSVVSLTAGFSMLFIAMFLPPKGEIHPTVITSFGMVLTFAGAMLGISAKYDYELTKFKTKAMEILRNRESPSDEPMLK